MTVKAWIDGEIREVEEEIPADYQQEPTIEERLGAVEETAETTAVAVEELIGVVMGGD